MHLYSVCGKGKKTAVSFLFSILTLYVSKIFKLKQQLQQKKRSGVLVGNQEKLHNQHQVLIYAHTHTIILSFKLFYAPWFLIPNPHFLFQPKQIKRSYLQLWSNLIKEYAVKVCHLCTTSIACRITKIKFNLKNKAYLQTLLTLIKAL